MKVVVKRPNESLKTEEVSGLEEINLIVGNVDEKGKGLNETGSDFRTGVFQGVDMHLNGSALFNANLPRNFWSKDGMKLYCGNVVFAGYNGDNTKNYGVCSLTDEQIEMIEKNIGTYFNI